MRDAYPGNDRIHSRRRELRERIDVQKTSSQRGCLARFFVPARRPNGVQRPCWRASGHPGRARFTSWSQLQLHVGSGHPDQRHRVGMAAYVGGFYTAASKGGTVLVLAVTTYTGLTGATVVVNPTIVTATLPVRRT